LLRDYFFELDLRIQPVLLCAATSFLKWLIVNYLDGHEDVLLGLEPADIVVPIFDARLSFYHFPQGLGILLVLVFH